MSNVKDFPVSYKPIMKLQSYITNLFSFVIRGSVDSGIERKQESKVLFEFVYVKEFDHYVSSSTLTQSLFA